MPSKEAVDMNILFVCQANMQRSPTAEELLKELADDKELEVRSAGILPNARNELDRGLINWADRVYVMTEGIEVRIKEEFPEASEAKEIKNLGILDQYRKQEPRLRRRLKEAFSEDDLLSRFVRS